jgi:hypothetical protein
LNFSSWGIKSATPSDDYAEWDVTFNLSSWGIKSATPSWPLCWLGYYLQHIFMRDEIRHPLWPLCWMGRKRLRGLQLGTLHCL